MKILLACESKEEAELLCEELNDALQFEFELGGKFWPARCVARSNRVSRKERWGISPVLECAACQLTWLLPITYTPSRSEVAQRFVALLQLRYPRLRERETKKASKRRLPAVKE